MPRAPPRRAIGMADAIVSARSRPGWPTCSRPMISTARRRAMRRPSPARQVSLRLGLSDDAEPSETARADVLAPSGASRVRPGLAGPSRVQPGGPTRIWVGPARQPGSSTPRRGRGEVVGLLAVAAHSRASDRVGGAVSLDMRPAVWCYHVTTQGPEVRAMTRGRGHPAPRARAGLAGPAAGSPGNILRVFSGRGRDGARHDPDALGSPREMLREAGLVSTCTGRAAVLSAARAGAPR